MNHEVFISYSITDKKIAMSIPGRMAGPIGFILLYHDLTMGMLETMSRINEPQEKIVLREHAINEIPAWKMMLLEGYATFFSFIY